MVYNPPKITLEAARINANLTLDEAAKALGVHKNTLINWEKDSSNIKISYLSKISEVYKYPTDYIFFGKTLELKSS